MEFWSINERRAVALILALYALSAFAYSLLMPIWEAPDEPAHYHLAWRLARFGPWPSLRENYESDQPRAFYYLGSLVIRGLDHIDRGYSDYFLPTEYSQNMFVPVRRFDWNASNYRFLWGVYILRWINIVFGGLALWLFWRAFVFIVPGAPSLRLAALCLAAFTPQFLHIMSSVSNDPMGVLAGALLFYLAVRLVVTDSTVIRWLSVPLAVILPLTTKLTVTPLSVALLLIVVWQLVRSPARRLQLAIAALAAAAVLFILYFVDPPILKAAAYELTWRLSFFRPDAFSPKYIAYISGQIIHTYWGWLGWLAISLPLPILIALPVLGLIGMVLSARWLFRTPPAQPERGAWIVTWLSALLTIGAVMKNGLTTSASQGRFLFPAIGALSLLMIQGWHSVLPERYQRALPLMVSIIMLSCTLILWQFGVLPVYYQSFIDK